MSGTRRLLAFGAVVAAAACVDIATGPQGVASVRLLAVPPSIVIGDTLRDSSGKVVTLHAVAFGAGGDTIKDAEFRFTGLALPKDTTAAQREIPLVVDSLTGAVRAITPTVANRARLAVRLGDRLQVLDTITLVKKPTQFARTNPADTVLKMAFSCSDTGRATLPQQFILDTVRHDTVQIGSAQPITVTLTADSTGAARAPVPSYYVRYDITSPAKIPTTQFRGVTRPVFYIITDIANDRRTNADTTESGGTGTAYLRVLPAGLGSGVFADSIIEVGVRALALTTPKDTVKSPVDFKVRLRRITSLGDATGPGCTR